MAIYDFLNQMVWTSFIPSLALNIMHTVAV